MITDPHADYVPGLGCGCARCKVGLLDVEPVSPEVHAARQRAYAAERRGIVTELGYDQSTSIRAPGAVDRAREGSLF